MLLIMEESGPGGSRASSNAILTRWTGSEKKCCPYNASLVTKLYCVSRFYEAYVAPNFLDGGFRNVVGITLFCGCGTDADHAAYSRAMAVDDRVGSDHCQVAHLQLTGGG